MSKRDGYQAGVPCWVAAVLPDPEAGVAFYTGLFGWQAADTMPPEGAGRYFVCTLGGRDVAAVGSGRGGEPGQPVPADVVGVMLPQGPDPARDAPPPSWSVDFWVPDPDATAAKAATLGAGVLVPPFDTPVGRTGVLADPQGASFSISQVPTP